MAKKFGKFFTLAVAAGTAAAAAYYYVQNKKKEQALAGAGFDADDFEDDDLSFDDPDFSDSDFDDDDFVDESDPDCAYHIPDAEAKVFTSGTNEQGHTYVTLDLNAAQDKVSHFCGTVVNKLEESVQKIRSTPEYETAAARFNETADKIRNSEEAQAFGAAAHAAAEAVNQTGQAAADLAKDAAKTVAAGMQQAAESVSEAVHEAKEEASEAMQKTREEMKADSCPAPDTDRTPYDAAADVPVPDDVEKTE